MTAEYVDDRGKEPPLTKFILKYWVQIAAVSMFALWFIRFTISVDDAVAKTKEERIEIEQRVKCWEQKQADNNQQLAVLDDRTKLILDILKRMENRR